MGDHKVSPRLVHWDVQVPRQGEGAEMVWYVVACVGVTGASNWIVKRDKSIRGADRQVQKVKSGFS